MKIDFGKALQQQQQQLSPPTANVTETVKQQQRFQRE
jgi:hypothetical protein